MAKRMMVGDREKAEGSEGERETNRNKDRKKKCAQDRLRERYRRGGRTTEARASERQR